MASRSCADFFGSVGVASMPRDMQPMKVPPPSLSLPSSTAVLSVLAESLCTAQLPAAGIVSAPPGLGSPTQPVRIGSAYPQKPLLHAVGSKLSPAVDSLRQQRHLRQLQLQQLQRVLLCTGHGSARHEQEVVNTVGKAFHNLNQLKAIDDFIAAAFAAAGAFDPLQLTALEKRRDEINQEQQILFHWLQQAHEPSMLAAAQASQQEPQDTPTVQTRSQQGAHQPAACRTSPQCMRQTANESTLELHHHDQPTLSGSLQLLADENPECLFTVRRINRLGFKGVQKLKRHFSKYGHVVRVVVAHSTVRQHIDPTADPQHRPSSLGFVQMASKHAVQRVLAFGEEQQVEDAMIRVQRFARPPSSPCKQSSGSEHDDERAEDFHSEQNEWTSCKAQCDRDRQLRTYSVSSETISCISRI